MKNLKNTIALIILTIACNTFAVAQLSDAFISNNGELSNNDFTVKNEVDKSEVIQSDEEICNNVKYLMPTTVGVSLDKKMIKDFTFTDGTKAKGFGMIEKGNKINQNINYYYYSNEPGKFNDQMLNQYSGKGIDENGNIFIEIDFLISRIELQNTNQEYEYIVNGIGYMNSKIKLLRFRVLDYEIQDCVVKR